MPRRNPANSARFGAIGRSSLAAVALVAVALAAMAACSSERIATDTSSTPVTASSPANGSPATTAPRSANDVASSTTSTAAPKSSTTTVTSRPTPTDSPTTTTPVNVYAGAGPGKFSPAVFGAKQYVYVPSNDSGTVTVIDQATMKVIDHFAVGKLPQHVVPSWDLRTLYATASGSNRLVPIDPLTGKPGKPISVAAPYNLYFTPDGTTAVVMAERLDTINYYDTTTWTRIRSVETTGCVGVNHADWSADGSFFMATCEFSGDLIKVDTATGQIDSTIKMDDGAMPQDLRLAPDGSKFYVADMMHGGTWIVNRDGTAITGFIATGVGAHGIYPSRDGTLLYVTNRGRLMNDVRRRSREGEGSISVIDPHTDSVVATWAIPGGGSPDMGGVSADGTKLWVSGRYDSEVYVFDTTSGSLLAKIPVPSGPHGLCVFPQPGQYSLGHTGNYR
jgi:YVTN family beta-propeller protein